jgi:HlyD family secretion protein
MVSISGFTISSSERNLNSEIAGRVTRVYVHRADRVKAGDRLLDIDTIPMMFSFEEHVAGLANARAVLKQASALLREKRDQFRRSEVIASLDPGAWSASMRDSSVSLLSLAIADSLAAESKVASSVVEVQNDRRNIGRSRLRAPASGTVVQVGTAVGEVVFPQSPSDQSKPLITLLGTESIRFQGWVTEQHLTRLHVGDSAAISIKALDGRTFKSVVAEIGYSARSFGSGGDLERAYKVLIDFVGDKPPAFFGQTANAEVSTGSLRDVLSVPLIAIVGEPQQETDTARAQIRRPQARGAPADIPVGVFVVTNQRAQFRRVRLGPSSMNRVVVLQGVQPGERVVVGPFRTLLLLQNGDLVQ